MVQLALAAVAVAMLVSPAVGQVSTTSGTSSAVSRTSSSPTSTRTSSAASSTSSTSGAMNIALPPLVLCQYATFSFTVPQELAGLPKHLGFYPSATSNWIETYDLPDAYSSLTEGSFTWLVDLPVGLSVGAMFYVTDPDLNSQVPPNGSASTSDGVVLAGTSSGCLAGNEGASTTAVVSYASKFDPTFVWSSAKETGSSTPGSPSGSTNTGGSSTPVGAVVGGVVGGIAAITILASVLFYLKRKHDRQSSIRDDGYSVYSGRSAYAGEKRGSANPRYGGGTGGHPGSVLGVPASEPPPGTYWGQDESGNTILLALPGQGMDHHGQGMESLAHGQGMEMGEMGSNGGFSEAGLAHGMPRQTAAMGTLPEPMGDDSASTLRGGAHPNPFESNTERSSTPPPTSSSPTSPFTPQQELKAYAHPSLGHQQQQPPLDDPNSFAPSMHRGAEGLDDPNSFSPARQTAQRSDTGFFTAESHER